MTQPTCYLDDCDRIHHAQGLCSIHYDRQRKAAMRAGRWEPVEVDAAPFKERIKQFLDLGYTYTMLEGLTGVERHTFARALLKDRQSVIEDNVDRLNRVPLLPLWQIWRKDLGCDYRVPSYLAARRVRALMAKGYTTTLIAKETGLTNRTIGRLAHHEEECDLIMRSNLVKIAEVYDRLWDQEPPVPHHRSLLTKYIQWPLPIEWDEDELDHPDSGAKVAYRARRRWQNFNRRSYFQQYQAQRRASTTI